MSDRNFLRIDTLSRTSLSTMVVSLERTALIPSIRRCRDSKDNLAETISLTQWTRRQWLSKCFSPLKAWLFRINRDSLANLKCSKALIDLTQGPYKPSLKRIPQSRAKKIQVPCGKLSMQLKWLSILPGWWIHQDFRLSNFSSTDLPPWCRKWELLLVNISKWFIRW